MSGIHSRDVTAMKRCNRRDGEVPTELADRTAASGRLYQPRGSAVSAALWAAVAPFRVLQRPFAGTEHGMGWVVLARAR